MTTTRTTPAAANGPKSRRGHIGDALLDFTAYWLPFPPLGLPPSAETSLGLDLDQAVATTERHGPSPAPDFGGARMHGGHPGGMSLAGAGRAGHLRGSSRSR